MKTAQTLAIGALLLAACGTAPKDNAPLAGAAAAELPAGAAEAAHEAKMVALPFRLDVSFSAAALPSMRDAGARLSIVADYYGAPKDKGMAGLDPHLGVWLGGDHETIDPSITAVTFSGVFDAARVARDITGDPRVKVVASPVRGAGGVTCTEFDEALPIAVETGGFVHCTLAGE